MIRSMTAFGSARLETEHGILTAEVRSVNNRYLDLNLRLPEDLRFAETRLRALVGEYALRGKIEFKLNYALNMAEAARIPDMSALRIVAGQLQSVRQWIPDVAAPSLQELLRLGQDHTGLAPDLWLPLCEEVGARALAEFQASREREGQRLAQAMLSLAGEMEPLVERVHADLPSIIQQHQERIAQKLREALAAACPEGLAAISGEELSARLAQEASLFGLRMDVAEELTRLRSHLEELHDILSSRHTPARAAASPASSQAAGPTPRLQAARRGHGKRLDFLFQEMNREANTLGSKSSALSTTQAAIDLKLLIEQLREQAQNIE